MAENLGDPKYTIHVVQNWFEEFRDQTEPRPSGSVHGPEV